MNNNNSTNPTENNQEESNQHIISTTASININNTTTTTSNQQTSSSKASIDLNNNSTTNNTSRKRGNIPTKFERRKRVKDLREDVTDELDLLLNAENGESPLILFELSINEWKKMQPNSIDLTDIYVEKPEKKSILHQKVMYRNYEFGTNITNNEENVTPTTLKLTDESDKINVDIINVLRIKQSMISIVTSKEELYKIFKNIVLMTSSRMPISNRNPFFHGSGKILLFIYKHTNAKDLNKNKWNDMLFKKVRSTKPNICVENGNNNHFRSQGYIAAWGNKALYARSASYSTVGQYVSRSPKNDLKLEEVYEKNVELEDLIACEIKKASSKFDKWFPNFNQLIAPILKVAYEKQNEDGDVNFKQQTISTSGLWQSEICINAVTRDFHTEKDITYTLITVPDQVHDNKAKKKPSTPIFLFQLNNNKILGFKLQKQSTFIFNGTMLTHRQYSENGYEDKKERNKFNHFYNIACYGNQRLFNHMRHSFRRHLGLES